MKLTSLAACLMIVASVAFALPAQVYRPGSGYVRKRSSELSASRRNYRTTDEDFRRPARVRSQDYEDELEEDEDEFEERPYRTRTNFRSRQRNNGNNQRSSRYSLQEPEYESVRPTSLRQTGAIFPGFEHFANLGKGSHAAGYASSDNGKSYSGAFSTSSGKNSKAAGYGSTSNQEDQEADNYQEERPQISCTPQKAYSPGKAVLWMIVCRQRPSSPSLSSQVYMSPVHGSPNPIKLFKYSTQTTNLFSPVTKEASTNGNHNQVKPTPSRIINFKSSSLVSARSLSLRREGPTTSPVLQAIVGDKAIYGNDMLHYSEATAASAHESPANNGNFKIDPNSEFEILKR